jgi:hypothetical protein
MLSSADLQEILSSSEFVSNLLEAWAWSWIFLKIEAFLLPKLGVYKHMDNLIPELLLAILGLIVLLLTD